MRRYRITLGGRKFDVKVLDDPRQEQVRVEVDGEIFAVGVEAVPAVTGVTAGEAAQLVVAPSPVTPARLPKFSETPELSGSPGSTVAAPLPGVIKSIGVRSGQQVAPNDKLLVIEAMKMDNVIRAPRGGTIGTIHVAEGRQVTYGEPLLEFTD